MDISYIKSLPRMFLNFLLADLLGFMMLALTVVWGTMSVSLIFAGIFPTVMLLGMNYNFLWKLGFKDPNAIKIYKRKYCAFKGELISLYALIPFSLFAVLGYVFKNPLCKVIYNMTAIFTYGFYVNFPFKFIYVYLIFAVIYILFGGFAYRLGYKQISLYNNVIFRKEK